MKVLVTGANGHIGSNVVRSLLAQDYQVKAFIRKGADTRGLDGLDIEYCYGDVMKVETLEEAVVGCDAVIHLAAESHVDNSIKDPLKLPSMGWKTWV